jgi:hypothetical protein
MPISAGIFLYYVGFQRGYEAAERKAFKMRIKEIEEGHNS